MDVYLVPVGAERYEPYCETPDGADVPAGDAPSRGVVRRLWHRFQEMLRAAERAQREDDDPNDWSDRIMRWVAEKVAEQRLLWHLRRQQSAALHFPSDLDRAEAMATLRWHLARDADRHRRWMVVEAVLAAITGPLLFFVPGPNLVAYYFVFRAVGHYLSYRGARHGLDAAQWTAVASDGLAEVRAALRLDDHDERARLLGAIAARLQLQHFALFVQRVAQRGA